MEPETEHEDATSGDRVDRLEEKFDSFVTEVREMLSGAHTAAAAHEADKLDRPTRTVETTQQHAASLQDEIRAELAKLRKQEAAEKKQADLETRVAKAEKAAERPPREFRRIHHAMGWVTDADR